jgi:hypothetical protein
MEFDLFNMGGDDFGSTPPQATDHYFQYYFQFQKKFSKSPLIHYGAVLL